MKRNVIIDCDPGLDDAIALMLATASDKLNIMAVTTIGGNSSVEQTAQNALDLLDLYGRSDIPVAQGLQGAIMKKFYIGSQVHGEGGLGGVSIPRSNGEISDLRAHELMRDIVRSSEDKVTLIATGPLTNVAVFCLLYPELLENIEEIVFMGGSSHEGNVTAVAEANINNDPEALHIILNTGLPITMAGLNLTQRTQIYPHEFDELESVGGPVAKATAEFLRNHYSFYEGKPGFEGDVVHDACAVAYVIDPTIFKGRHLNMQVELCGNYSRGATIVDLDEITDRPKNTFHLDSVDRDAFFKLMKSSVIKHK